MPVQQGIENLRFGAFVVGCAMATIGFWVAFGWAVGIGVLGGLIVLGALLEKH